MNTHELANQLELLAKILRSLPDSEVGEVIAKLLSLVEVKKQEAVKVTTRTQQPLPVGIEERLKNMTPAEIEKHLGSEAEPFSTSQLQELAGRLGVSTSKRQSRSALVNLITRYFEANQMDSIIRSSRKEEPTSGST